MANEIDALRAWVDESTLNYTRYTFRNKTGRKFVVARHHRIIADAIDRVLACDPEYRYLMINIPPRYSKTEMVIKALVGRGLAMNPRSRFLHLSYSKDLALDNSKEIMATIKSEFHTRLYPDLIVNDRGAQKWYTTEGGGFYAVSSEGQVTGFGAGLVDDVGDADAEDWTEEDLDDFFATHPEANIFNGAILIDDPVKPEDAISDVKRERVNFRFENTIRSRANSRRTPIIVIMQRLHEHDLCGYLLEKEGRIEEGGKWKVISLPALWVDENGEKQALWAFKHKVEELEALQRVEPFVFETQYQQNPKPLEGLMYPQPFKTYEVLPTERGVAKNYTDTADTGTDYLCSVCYNEYPSGLLYVTDVLYTKKPMEYTEPETARMLTRNGTQIANVESNNGGRGFARAVERNLRELGNRRTSVRWFSQSKNKDVRIFSQSAAVQNMILFPSGWQHRWPEFHGAIIGYRKEGHNANDDAPDTLTGMVEMTTQQNTTRFERT